MHQIPLLPPLADTPSKKFRQHADPFSDSPFSNKKPARRVELRQFTEEELRRVQGNMSLLHTTGIPIENAVQFLQTKKPIVAIASTQPKKRMEMEAALHQTNAKVIDAIDFLSWFLSADEVSHTYLGNAYEKLEHILDRVYDMMGYENVAAKLKENGYDIKNVVVSVNDCGFAFDQNYSQEPEFQDSRHEHGRTGKFPDVELGPIFDASGGVREFFNKFWAMVERKKLANEPYALHAKDKALYLFTKLAPKREDNQIISSFAQIPVMIAPVPKPDDGHINTERYFIPVFDGMDPQHQRKTIAEIGLPFWEKYSAQALAVQACAPLMGAYPSIRKESNRVFVDKRKKVLLNSVLNYLMPPSETTHGVFLSFLRHKIRFKREFIDANRPEAIQDLNKDTKGTVLGPLPDWVAKKWSHHFLRVADFFFTKIVDNQLRMGSEENRIYAVIEKYKPIVSQKKNKDLAEEDFIRQLRQINPAVIPWTKFIEFHRYLHEKGFIKQERQYLFELLSGSEKSVLEKLKQSIQKNIEQESINETSFCRFRHDTETYGQDRTDKYEVSILGSASTRVDIYAQEAKELGHWLAERGIHLRTGGGRHGIMGAVTDGYVSFMEANPQLAAHCHVSAIQMYRTAYFEGVGLLPDDCHSCTNKFLMIAKSFDERMISIFRSDTTLAMAPGIGTYQEMVRFMRLRKEGILSEGKNKLIAYNHEQINGNRYVRMMDVFLNGLLPSSLKPELTIRLSLEDIKKQIETEYAEKYGHPPVKLVDCLDIQKRLRGFTPTAL